MPAIASLYEENKSAASRRWDRISRDGRDIGEPPDCVDPARRGACEVDFRRFCEVYFPQTFALAWSDDHLEVIRKIEVSALRGGLFAVAMPRAAGKSSLCEAACLWAILYGHRSFVVLIGSDEGRAVEMLGSIKTEFESNELLFDDFPEVCHPIVSLEGIAHRCNGQLCNGERTHIGWSADEIVMPTVAGSKVSGAILRVAGITGGVRGMKAKRQDGTSIRPDLVIVDDPQTDASANSAAQCVTRERILAGAILGLAGPGKKISGIMPCTVIRPGDMADRMLSRELHPEWNGTRTKMVYSFPTDEKLWEEYAKIRAESLRAGHDGREATEFYAANREAMDAGAVVAWEARHDPDELSAIQHAINLKLRDERAFAAEYQNEPLPEVESRSDDLTSDQIAAKVNRTPRGVVPISCSRLTAFVDVQGSLLYYVVCAWEDAFTGYVVDYGAFPEQGRAYFRLSDAKPTLQDAFPSAGLEGQIYGGLEALTASILGRAWDREDGATLRVERCLIDAGWGASTATIKLFCRQTPHAAVVVPSFGRYIGASGTPMAEYKTRPGDRVGLNWRVIKPHGQERLRTVTHDTNFWKSFVHRRLAVAMGDRGCLSLFGDRPADHRLFAEHLTAEYAIRTSGRGREVDEWKLRPGSPDNHFLDCLSGCAVAASIQGVILPETVTVLPSKRGRVSFAEMQRRRRRA